MLLLEDPPSAEVAGQKDPMWRILKTDEYERRFKRYNKKRKNQLDAVLNNADRFFTLLRSGKPPRPLPCGFLRDEGLGILRVSESGGGSNVAATRLYVYPDATVDILYFLTIGDKATQGDDIRNCKRFVNQIQADPSLGDEQNDEHEEDEDPPDDEGHG